MITADQLPSLPGSTLKNTSDEKIGKIVDAFAAPDGSYGTFVSVNTARVGHSISMVPIMEATLDGDELVVPYAKSLVKEAPQVQSEDTLSPTDENRLCSYYEVPGDLLTS